MPETSAVSPFRRLLSDRVLIKRTAGEKTHGRIIIPDALVKDASTEGTVIDVGPGLLRKDGSRKEMKVRPGDRVLFKAWEGNEIKIKGDPYVIVFEEAVDGVFDA